jgi:hypothetical protein
VTNIPGLNPTTVEDAEDTSGRIKANSLNTTRLGSIGAAAAGIIAAVSPIFSASKTDPVAVQAVLAAGKGLAVASAILAVAWVLSADTRARSHAAASATTAPAVQTGAQVINMPRQFNVHVQNRGDGHAVALRAMPQGAVEYLVIDLPNHGPLWVAEGNIG